MRTKRWVFFAVVALQAGFLLAWAGYHERLRRTAPVVRLQVEPFDPRDIVRGQYFRLGYAINRMPANAMGTWTTGQEVWVGLDEQDGFGVVGGVYLDRAAAAPHAHAVRGWIASPWSGRPERIEYGIEEYYVPEGTATPDFQQLTAEATVSRGGELHLRQVFLAGRPWP